MIAIVDYGVGNLFSLASSLAAVGVEATATSDKEVIRSAEKIILPGVGAFRDARDKLFASGLADVVLEQAASGKPILGICLGMNTANTEDSDLFAEKSDLFPRSFRMILKYRI